MEPHKITSVLKGKIVFNSLDDIYVGHFTNINVNFKVDYHHLGRG